LKILTLQLTDVRVALSKMLVVVRGFIFIQLKHLLPFTAVAKHGNAVSTQRSGHDNNRLYQRAGDTEQDSVIGMVSLALCCQKQSNFYAIAVATRWMPLTVHVGQAGRCTLRYLRQK